MTQTSERSEETFLFAGGLMTILVAGSDTDDRYALLLARVPPGNATPPHFHDADAEHLLMLDGTITAETAGQTTVYQPGEVAVLPPRQAHRLANTGSVDATYLLLCAPARFEQFIRTVGRLVDPAAAMQPMDETDVQRLVANAPLFGVHLTDEAALIHPVSVPPVVARPEQFEALGSTVEVLARHGDGENAVVVLRAATPARADVTPQSGATREPINGMQLFAANLDGGSHFQISSSAPAGLLVVTTGRVTRLLRDGCLPKGFTSSDGPQEQLLALLRVLHRAEQGPSPSTSKRDPLADARGGFPIH